MKLALFFMALVMIIAMAFAQRSRKVDSCYDDVTTEKGCMVAWEDEAGDNDPTNFVNACQWCVSRAVPSVCASHQQTTQLPPGVFICSNVTATPKY